jgi:hypothetical protein
MTHQCYDSYGCAGLIYHCLPDHIDPSLVLVATVFLGFLILASNFW